MPNKVFQSNPELSDPTIFKNKELDVTAFINTSMKGWGAGNQSPVSVLVFLQPSLLLEKAHDGRLLGSFVADC